MKHLLRTLFLLCTSLIAFSQNESDNIPFDDDLPEYIVPSDGSDTIFLFPKEKAEFIGGMDSLAQYLVQNINYPPGERVYNGTVMGKFVIEKDGSVTNVEIISRLAEDPDNEVLRVLSAMPRWKPAKNNGKPCRCLYSIPVRFAIQ